MSDTMNGVKRNRVIILLEGGLIQDDGPPQCRWFARCNRPATGATPHPVLGDVPTCDRCHKFATGEDRL